MSEQNFPTKGIYQHYKGGLYTVKDIAIHTETGDHYVVYEDGKTTWIRPLSMWMESVKYEGNILKRFTPLSKN